MARIDVSVDFDDDSYKDKLDGMQRRGRDFSPVMEDIRDELQKAWTANFTANGLAVGGWKPLDAKYGAWKAVHFPGAPPLVQTGHLFQAIASLRGNSVEINRDGARFNLPNISYAKFHQYGTTKMPKREIMFEPEGANRRWAGMMQEHVLGERDIQRIIR
jgi:phage gpG-like protein